MKRALGSSRRLEVEAGLFVDWRRGRIGLRGASWRGFGALDFEERVGGGDRNAPFRGRTGPNSRALWLSVNRIAG